jgi:hypothetical protein
VILLEWAMVAGEALDVRALKIHVGTEKGHIHQDVKIMEK